MTDDDGRDHQFMAMAAAAATLKRLFDAYVAAGFTEAQALQLVAAVMMEGMKNTR